MNVFLIEPLSRISCLLRQYGRVILNQSTKENINYLLDFKGICNHKSFYIAGQFSTKVHEKDHSKPLLNYCQKSEFCSSSLARKQTSSGDEAAEEEKDYEELVKRTLKLSDDGHNVLVIQPHIKWGNLKKRNTTPELQLSEAIALIKTLPRWSVADSRIISLTSFKSPRLFGKGNLETLSKLVSRKKDITAVFISLNTLSPAQHEELEGIFKVPVFDRYTIVVQIFKLHAVTEEAKIQVAMGEIPYLWSRLRYDKEETSDKMGGGATVGGPGETHMEIKRRLLQDKERKLKNELSKLKARRDLLRQKREKLALPIVAVVGYTNAGKTALIKALTEEEELQPRNALFATLDVTVHGARMPSGLKVLFVDTVGFISDVPTGLIQSFVCTLEDALRADLIVHVRDISHPDVAAQHAHVTQTLCDIHLPQQLADSILTVSNKIDLLPRQPSPDLDGSLLVSATLGIGIQQLKFEIEKRIVEATDQMFIKIRVPNGGPELGWLHREATVVRVVADEADNQFAFVNTIISEANLNKFKHKFILSSVKQR